MKTETILKWVAVASGVYFLWRWFASRQAVSAVPGAQYAFLTTPAPSASEVKGAGEIRYQPVASIQRTFDPYVQDHDPSLGEKIQSYGSAAEIGITVIDNIFSKLGGLFGGTTGKDRADVPLLNSSVSFGSVPPGDTVHV